MTSHATASGSSDMKISFLPNESLKPNETQYFTQENSIAQPATEMIAQNLLISSMSFIEGYEQTYGVTRDSIIVFNENDLKSQEDEEKEDPP